MISRRSFAERLVLGAVGATVAATACSYARIVGSSERVNFAVIGLHGRA